MSYSYRFEPSYLEVLLTTCIGHTLLSKYYLNFVEKLDINESDRVLDYGCGCGILSKKIANKLKSGHLTYIDVSSKWLSVSKRRLRLKKNTIGYQINDFTCQIGNGEYDKIIVHYTLHDFPRANLKLIIKQLLKHLHKNGSLIIREPIDIKHGLPLYEVCKVLEHFKAVTSSYRLHCNEILGDCAEIICRFK